jgi:hypothetical protein
MTNNSRAKWVLFFFVSAGALLLLTATAKFISARGNAGILDTPDPVFLTSYRHELPLVGVIESGVAIWCIFGHGLMTRAMLLAWLSSMFIAYRVAVFVIEPFKTCPCLGTITQALHIPPQTANAAMIVALAYLFSGSWGTLFWLWKKRRSSLPGSQAVATA